MRLLNLVIAAAFAATMLAPVSSFAGPQEGRKAWMKLNCNGCHGNNGGGGMGPNIQHEELGDVNEAMHGDAREGGMRSYIGVSQLGPNDAANIAAYLKSVGTPQEPKWVDWWRH